MAPERIGRTGGGGRDQIARARVRVHDGDAAQVIVALAHVDRAPVGEKRYRETHDRGQRLVVVERTAEDIARLGEKGQLTSRILRLGAGAARRLDGTRPCRRHDDDEKRRDRERPQPEEEQARQARLVGRERVQRGEKDVVARGASSAGPTPP